MVPDFLVQTGDRTGTGAGGESFFGGAYTPPRCTFFVFYVRTDGRQQNSSRMRFIHVYDLRIAGSLGWRMVARRTQMIHNSSSRSVRSSLTSCMPSPPIQSWNDVDRADELQGKHTLFGRCVGDTIYSASSSFSTAILCH